MKEQIYFREKSKLEIALNAFTSKATVLVILFLIIRCYEMIQNTVVHGMVKDYAIVFVTGIANDLLFLLILFIPLFIIYALIYLANQKIANIFITSVGTLICVLQLVLVQYASSTLVLLGGDFWQYSSSDIQQTIMASGQTSKSIIVGLTGLVLIIFLFIYLSKKIKASTWAGLILIVLAIANYFLHPMNMLASSTLIQNESEKVLATDKIYHFISSSTGYFFPEKQEFDIYSDNYSGDFENNTDTTIAKHQYINEAEYPFLHSDTAADVLSAYFKPSTAKPNIVIILYEGLGRVFSNNGAAFGSFTPFLDSLSDQSLYWENFLSEGGRTFAALPSLLGSLPFGKNGFNEFGENMPNHLSLLSLLKYNGYNTSFYYGGNSHFDLMDVFLRKNETTDIFDINSFPTNYIQLPKNAQGYTWGYGDKELYRWYLENKKTTTEPYCNVLLTVATHDPFLVNEQQLYLDKFEKWLVNHNISPDRREELRHYKYQFASVLYADDALRAFFNAYAQRPDFNNTIFFITGDHQMPEVPMGNKIDRYHVPLVVYSPLLARTARFRSVSTHFDITPTILAFLKTRCHIELPKYTAWMGTNIDTVRVFRNTHSYPIMQTKNDIVDFVMGEYQINNGDLYKISATMELDKVDNETTKKGLIANFDAFKIKNKAMIDGKKIIPDTIYNKYHNK